LSLSWLDFDPNFTRHLLWRPCCFTRDLDLLNCIESHFEVCDPMIPRCLLFCHIIIDLFVSCIRSTKLLCVCRGSCTIFTLSMNCSAWNLSSAVYVPLTFTWILFYLCDLAYGYAN
jgi:hypothetical protein